MILKQSDFVTLRKKLVLKFVSNVVPKLVPKWVSKLVPQSVSKLVPKSGLFKLTATKQMSKTRRNDLLIIAKTFIFYFYLVLVLLMSRMLNKWRLTTVDVGAYFMRSTAGGTRFKMAIKSYWDDNLCISSLCLIP